MPLQATLTTRSSPQLTSGRQTPDCAIGCDKARIAAPFRDHAVAAITVAGVKVSGIAVDDITVDLMGGLRIRAGLTTMGPRDLGGTKLRRVLLALLMHRGSPVSKDRLIELLWEGSPPSGARATLESYVCVLRKKLQPVHDTRSSLITTQAGCYAIDMIRVDLDVVRYENLMSAALRPDTPAIDALPMLETAMTMVESPLLPEEIDCEWLDELRVTHSQKVRRGLIAAADKVAELKSDSAQRWARLALEGDSLDESAWHALLKSMEASGQHADGLREYDHCRRLLAAELGCTPGPSLQELYVRLLRGANGDDEQLGLLFDAVLKLHAASKVGVSPPLRALGSKRSHASDQSASVKQAYRALDLLLRSVGIDHKKSGFALGA